MQLSSLLEYHIFLNTHQGIKMKLAFKQSWHLYVLIDGSFTT